MKAIDKTNKDYFIADNATVLGDVTIGENSSFWFGTVARGDMNFIKIGKYTNIQDNAVLHMDRDAPLTIGDYVSVGHGAIVHGCEIGDNCLIGIGAIVLSRSVIGENCIIGAGSLVTEDAVIPPNSLVMGIPGKVKRQLTDEEIANVKDIAERYARLWREQYK